MGPVYYRDVTPVTQLLLQGEFDGFLCPRNWPLLLFNSFNMPLEFSADAATPLLHYQPTSYARFESSSVPLTNACGPLAGHAGRWAAHGTLRATRQEIYNTYAAL